MGLGNFYTSAISALHVAQRGITVVSTNISNVNTKGYSKQVAVIKPRDPQMLGGHEFGLGVDISEVKRTYDAFIENRLLSSQNEKSQWKSLSDQMSQVESIFNELDSEGLGNFLASFLDSFNDISADASASAPRQNTLSKADILIDRFHRLRSDLGNFRESLNLQVKSTVDKINTITQEIVGLNDKIKNFPAEALTYRDERQMRVRELSELIDINTVEMSDGEFQVFTSGFPIVIGAYAGEFSVAPDPGNDGLYSVNFTLGSSDANVTTRVEGGQLGMLLQTRDTTAKDYVDRLDELAFRLVTTVNTVHRAGFNLAGANDQYFFADLATSASAARLIELDTDVAGKPNAIAASENATDLPSGNAVAKQLAALRDTSIAFTSVTTNFLNFHSMLLADVGTASGYAQKQAEFAENVYDQTEMERERISGVSVDEEELDLMKYKAAYEAAARLISVGTELLDVLVKLG